MQFKQGTHVYTSDGRDAGTVDRVVLDPQTNQVTDLVVRKGWLFIEDKVVPIEMVASAAENRVTLRQTESDLQKLPKYEETYYVRAAEEDLHNGNGTPRVSEDYPEPVYSYPPVGATWWGVGAYNDYMPIDLQPEFTPRVQKNIPEGTVAVREGARVLSHDGKHVGDVEEVFIDSASNRAAHLLISHGTLSKTHKLIPTNWIKEEDDDEVILTVDTSVVDHLPEYVPTP